MSKTKQKSDDTDSVGVSHTLRVTVPDTWEVVPLETVLEDIVGGGTPSRDNPSYWDGSIPWLTVKDMRTRRPEDSIDHISDQAVRDSATNIIPADTVIIATRIGLGKVIRVPYDAAINQDLKALITKPAVDKSYLEYWIYSIANYLESIGSGTTVKGIRLEHVRSLPFPLAPLDQQKRIVAEIEKQFSRLDEAVSNLKRVKANLKRYKTAVLKAAVEGRLVETEAERARREGRSYETGAQLLQRILETRRSQWKGKGKYKEPAAPDTTDLPELPEGWVWTSPVQLSAGEQYALAIGPFGSSLKVSDYTDSGVPLVFVRNIRAVSFGGPDTVYVAQTKADELRAHLVSAGDLLVTKMGDPPGDVCIYPPHRPPAVITADCIKLRLARDILPTAFFAYAIESDLVHKQILGITKGVAQLKVSLGRFCSVGFPLPPIAEQHRIVAEVDRRLSVVREIEFQVDTSLQRAERLRQSILAKSFAGQLVTENQHATQSHQLVLQE